MVLDPGCAGFPSEYDDPKEDCRPKEWHDDRGVASKPHQVEEARCQITPLLGLSNERCDITDRNPGIPRSPKRDLCI
jgi:hypothetical protein